MSLGSERDKTMSAAPAPRAGWLIFNFAVTTALSAFLLFQVQPLISKYILPWFGGSPSVWSTAMVFFQIVLFAGYLYAHGLIRYLTPKQQGLVHGALLIIAVFLSQIAPDESWKPTAADNPTWRILCLLGATVGVPYFALSSTGPLLQAWFSRAYPCRSPYRLYALSNAGSLLALVSYPFLIEPAWDLTKQAHVWSWGFIGFAITCVAVTIASVLGYSRSAADEPASTGSIVDDGPAPSWGRRALWLLLPAWASLLLLATTNQICENIAVIPFLWVAPLSLYLLTFIIAFDHSRWYHRPIVATAAVVALLAIAGFSDLDDFISHQVKRFLHLEYSLGTPETLAVYLGGMFLAALVCHGELVRLKPAPRYLTEFYLFISAGGALGGIFVSLVAPVIFRTLFEWQIALYGATAIAAFVAMLSVTHGKRALAAIVAVTVTFGAAWIDGWGAWTSEPLEARRNFYGTILARKVDGEGQKLKYVSLWHGSILHGRQFLDEERRDTPITYYPPESGVGRAIKFFQSKPNEHVGVIGLGAGTIAAYARAGDVYRIYEINPDIEILANKHFTYLKDARAKGAEVDIVLGDARLSMEREPPQEFDVLAVDAFSGDSIPLHLLTQEAVEIYLKHLKPGGILAMHITNHYLDLAPVTQGLAKHFDLDVTEIYVPPTDENEEKLVMRSQWVLLTKNQKFLKENPPEPLDQPWPAADPPLWTDHDSNLFKVLRHGGE